MKFNKDGYIIFESGKAIEANQGIVGIAEEPEAKYGYEVYEGYDGAFTYDGSTLFGCGSDDLTDRELVELIDFQIERWTKFKNNIKGNKPPLILKRM